LSPRRVCTLVTTLLVLVFMIGARPAAATVPTGFTDELVTALGSPTAIAFTPDGRMLASTQPGVLRVVQNGTLLTTPAIDLTSVTCSNSERGLLGIAVDPNFTANGFVYLYYTFKKFGSCPMNTSSAPVNRVSRFVMTGNTLGSELVLVDNIKSPNGNHNAGDLNFGKDGLLYISTGDGGCDYLTPANCGGANDASRDQNQLIGKILRVTNDGSIPASNPFQGLGTARCNVDGSTTVGNKCQETFAWGLRNPFRFAMDPNASGTVFHINDVGQNTWEEIDLGQSGADYGWNIREGFCVNGSTTNCGPPPPPPTGPLTNPIFAYGRADGCASITGGAFVPSGVWPAPYDGAYLFADYVCGKIFRLVPAGGGTYTRADFATGLGGSSAVHMEFGPAGSTQGLYYTTYAGGGQIRRITFTSTGNNPPTAVLNVNPASGPAPLNVTLNGSGSSDPDGDPITYRWTFGDGGTAKTSAPSIIHQYVNNGTYTASLRVVDSSGAMSAPATQTVTVGGAGNTPPTPTITSPASGATFAVGETITLTGSATDSEDGTIPATGLSWTVLRHHDTHTHPWFGPAIGNNLTFQAPAPEDLLSATNSYIEVILTATDSGGLSSTVSRNVLPRAVALTFATNPAGRTVTVAGTNLTGPSTVTSWEGWMISINATKQAGWVFVSWSDGGARMHTITTPSSPTTYTATFTPA
jgi:glucose/arabinose dehydrogenase